MRQFNFLKTASREASTLTGVASVCLLLKIIFFNQIPATFFGMYEFGQIIESILVSIIASYIFYLFVVHAKEHSDRKIIGPYIDKHAKRVVGKCMQQLADISRVSKVNLNISALSPVDVRKAFSEIPPYSAAPLLIGINPDKFANWLQYFVFMQEETKNSVRRLFDQLPFLDSRLLSILAAIDDCSHFHGVRLANQIPSSNGDLSVWAGPFYEYCMLCSALNLRLAEMGYSPIEL